MGPDNLVKGETGKRTGEVETGETGTGERRGERAGETKGLLTPSAACMCILYSSVATPSMLQLSSPSRGGGGRTVTQEG